MGFLLAVIAVIIIIVTGGNHPSPDVKPQPPEAAAAARSAPSAKPLPVPETLDDRTTLSASELSEQTAALDLDEIEQQAPTGPNPCVDQNGGMIPNCAAIARKTGEYEVSKQLHVISDWVHVWTR